MYAPMMPDMRPAEIEPKSCRILVIDDEKGLRDFLCYELAERGYEVAAAADAAEALEWLESHDFGLVISDVRMPGMDGVALLREIRRSHPRVEVILTTGFGTVETAVEAMKHGAFDFLLKPVEVERLTTAVSRALEAGELKALVALYKSSLALFRSVELSEVLPVIADVSRRLLTADRAAILLRDEHDRMTSEADTAAAREDGFTELVAAAYAGRGASAAADAGLRLEPGAAGAKSLLVQPLVAGGQSLGFLAAARNEPFSVQDQRHASLFAAQAAQAVRNAGLFHQLQATQNRLLQSEKLNAMGRVAAGIAHEINNPLTAILGNTQLVLDGARLAAQTRRDLEEVVENARRCRDIVRNLLEFAGRREPKKEALELVPLVESALKIARYGWNKTAKVSFERPERSPRILADAVQIKQVVVNLVRNALQAAEGRPAAAVTVSAEESGGRAFIRVADRGDGIPPQLLERLYEPFFTTKAPGKGTGLGLYLCRLLVERHGGSISARNREDGGAVFTVELPALP